MPSIARQNQEMKKQFHQHGSVNKALVAYEQSCHSAFKGLGFMPQHEKPLSAIARNFTSDVLEGKHRLLYDGSTKIRASAATSPMPRLLPVA